MARYLWLALAAIGLIPSNSQSQECDSTAVVDSVVVRLFGPDLDEAATYQFRLIRESGSEPFRALPTGNGSWTIEDFPPDLSIKDIVLEHFAKGYRAKMLTLRCREVDGKNVLVVKLERYMVWQVDVEPVPTDTGFHSDKEQPLTEDESVELTIFYNDKPEPDSLVYPLRISDFPNGQSAERVLVRKKEDIFPLVLASRGLGRSRNTTVRLLRQQRLRDEVKIEKLTFKLVRP